MRLKPSAITCSVTVLPVPVAPVISPWRFAIFEMRLRSSLAFATRISSAIGISSAPYCGFKVSLINCLRVGTAVQRRTISQFAARIS